MDLRDIRATIEWLNKLPVKDGWIKIGGVDAYYLKAPSINGDYYGILTIRTGGDPLIISEKDL